MYYNSKKNACLYEIFTLHSVYGPLIVWSFKYEIEKWYQAKSDETKQLLRMLKWQTLVVSCQDNDKMDAIVQCRGIFYRVGYSGKDYVEVCRLKKMWKTSKNFKKW